MDAPCSLLSFPIHVFQRIWNQAFPISLRRRYLYPLHIAGTLFHILTLICLHVHTFASFRILLHFTNIDKTSSSLIEAGTELSPIETARLKYYRYATISHLYLRWIRSIHFCWLVTLLSFSHCHLSLDASPNIQTNALYRVYWSLASGRTVQSLHLCTALGWYKDQTQPLEPKT